MPLFFLCEFKNEEILGLGFNLVGSVVGTREVI